MNIPKFSQIQKSKDQSVINSSNNQSKTINFNTQKTNQISNNPQVDQLLKDSYKMTSSYYDKNTNVNQVINLQSQKIKLPLRPDQKEDYLENDDIKLFLKQMDEKYKYTNQNVNHVQRQNQDSLEDIIIEDIPQEGGIQELKKSLAVSHLKNESDMFQK